MTDATNLVKPSDLGRSKIRVELPESEYSHQTQLRYRSGDRRALAITFNGTQTFDYKGKPSDSDNDK